MFLSLRYGTVHTIALWEPVHRAFPLSIVCLAATRKNKLKVNCHVLSPQTDRVGGKLLLLGKTLQLFTALSPLHYDQTIVRAMLRHIHQCLPILHSVRELDGSLDNSVKLWTNEQKVAKALP
jgi:hypothetical protein